VFPDYFFTGYFTISDWVKKYLVLFGGFWQNPTVKPNFHSLLPCSNARYKSPEICDDQDRAGLSKTF
jgi:hypothetical protein